MLPHDNYIMHFNKNHDPRNGQFTKGSGGSSNSNGSIKTNKKKMNPTLKKVLIGAGIATGVAAAAAGTYFISKHFNQKNSITKTANNIKKSSKKILVTKGKEGDWRDSLRKNDYYHIDDEFMNKQGKVFIKGINKNKKNNKYKLVGYKHYDSVGRQLLANGKFEPTFYGTQVLKNGEIHEYDTYEGSNLMKDEFGHIRPTFKRNIYSNQVKKIGNAIVKRMLVGIE